MTATDPLRAEYEALLHSEGLKPRQEWSEAQVRAFRASLSEPERALFAGNSLSKAGQAGMFDHLARELRETADAAGIRLPEPILVAEYPHNSFNAQARAARNGSLILVNTGFAVLVHEISKVHGASLRTFARDDRGEIVVPETTAADRRREHVADAVLASAVLSYIFQGDAGLGRRMPLDVDRSVGFAWHLGQATERFVIAHEFAHLIEGHLGTSAERETQDWLHRTRSQEFQADETGALLCLRALKDPDDQVMTLLAVAGPLFFFAIDHLITRVRNELDDIPQGLRLSDHPTSDERGAALRSLFQQMYGTSVLQIADACVQWLSWHEDDILAAARRRLPG